MSSALPNGENSENQQTEATSLGSRCYNCGGRLDLLVRVEPQTNGRPVTYYACARCAQVMVRKS
jgi:hypothetical protein